MKKGFGILVIMFIMNLAACSTGNRVTTDDLLGKWNIVSVDNDVVKTSGAFLEFTKGDKMMQVHGNAGCNLLNTEVKIDEKDASALSFEEPSITMMACTDMDTEDKILRAISRIARVKAGKSKAQMLLVDKDGNSLLTLEKSE